MGYTREQVLGMCKRSIGEVKTFYQKEIVNYTGKTTDTEEYYTEVVAEFICNNIERFRHDIPMITRKSSYRMESHIGRVPTSNRVEETIAIKMFNRSDKEGYVYPLIGKIIDYQTPLKSVQTDVAGKVDLLSYDGKELHILELKKPDSPETMLRCVMEGYTYLQTVNKVKMLFDFGLPKESIVSASPLVFKNGIQFREAQENRKWLKKLMVLLDSVPYYVVNKNTEYCVTEE